jgi:hypothetical protein
MNLEAELQKANNTEARLDFNTYRELVATKKIIGEDQAILATIMQKRGISVAAFEFDVEQLQRAKQFELELTNYAPRVASMKKQEVAARKELEAAELAFKEAKAAHASAINDLRQFESKNVQFNALKSRNLRLFGTPELLSDNGNIKNHYQRLGLPV